MRLNINLKTLIDSDYYYFKYKLLDNSINESLNFEKTTEKESSDNSEDEEINKKKESKNDFKENEKQNNSSYSIKSYFSQIPISNKDLELNEDRSSKDSSDKISKEILQDEGIENKYSIIKILDIIGKHDSTSEMIKEINGQLISYGNDKKISIYDINVNTNKKEYKCSNWINNIETIGSDNNVIDNNVLDNNICKLIIGTKNSFDYIKSDKVNSLELNKSDNNYNYFFKFNDKYVIIQDNKVSITKLSINKIIISSFNNIFEGYYKEGIEINENIFAITSNRIMTGGEDKISFYNIKTNKTLDIKGYSFILSTTGLCLLSIKSNNKPNDNKILLCACKKYLKKQKNGILLINNINEIFSNKKKEKYLKFYNTNNFEVHCFCQLSILAELYILKNSNVFLKTVYFLVGGFDNKKRKGIIKLFKIIKEENEIYNIKMIQDINIEDEKGSFKGFNKPISCITQSNVGNILITCWDGNVYSLSVPNLKTLISFDNQI